MSTDWASYKLIRVLLQCSHTYSLFCESNVWTLHHKSVLEEQIFNSTIFSSYFSFFILILFNINVKKINFRFSSIYSIIFSVFSFIHRFWNISKKLCVVWVCNLHNKPFEEWFLVNELFLSYYFIPLSKFERQ